MSGVARAADGRDRVPEHFAAVEREWRPEPVELSEFVTAAPARALAGLFDQEPPAMGVGDVLPPLWHWLYLLDRPAQADLGEDGHPQAGPFLPPLPDRRRMFGGGRLELRAPILVGDLLTRRSSAARVRVRRGGSGWLLLVTTRHELRVQGELRAVEEQDIVYKQPVPEAPAVTRPPTASTPTDPSAPWTYTLRPDPALLFRFSALTYNAHRIHYDRDYATEVEGYPDLVVHGPLLALALLELPRRFAPERRVESFAYRLRSPLFLPDEVRVAGQPAEGGAELNAGTRGGAPACTGTVGYA
ncbi:FAS1-like dehydratase domain-containing protein [Streptomyces cavernicola]|uniref:MaoC family dehydratase N-terminal domain-containing protein n=1 Tax=Streptomyces cavernicola TaxID=3043613 RepID=A0ABT6SFH7_9ACTN|nr:MaoC family dehydratase N-terminal domain-containing protein [Streptomyces sp. B-S-A6]MDI3406941.1 MaoC family dehydratase N-terminal domain-containing protein [Streptomyces sp. B-S-A6]